MKSMSWLLFEKEHGFLRECPACGFSTCSPSIYRRHSRHCDASNSAEETANSTSPVISCEAFTGFPSSVESKLPADVSSSPSVDFPSISSKPTADFSEVSCQSSLVGSQALVSDETLESEVSDQLDHSTDPIDHSTDHIDHSTDQLDHSTEQAGLETGACEKSGSCELQQLRRELTSDCHLSACSVTGDDSLSVSDESLADSLLASDAADAVAMTTCDAVDSVNYTDARLHDSADKMNHKSCDMANNTTELVTHVSHCAGTEDELREEVSRLDDSQGACSKYDSEADSQPAEDTAAAGGDSSPGLIGDKTQTTSEKSPEGQTSSSLVKQRRCKHCKCAVSGRLDRRAHMQSKHPDKVPVYRCRDCNYCSLEHKNYERHLLRHLLSGPFRCNRCSFSSTSQSSIKRHVALQHSDHSNTSAGNVASSEIPPKVAREIPLTPSGGVVDGSDSRDSSSDIPLLPSDANGGERQETCDSSDDVGTSRGHGNSTDAETEAADKAATPETSRDMIEVEVRNSRNEETGAEESWWTCLACGCRYNERAKVRRHVKCKHRVPLTSCRLHDLRTTTQSDLTLKLQPDKAEPSTTTDQASATNVTTKSINSGPASGAKFSPTSSFVKIAPKPIQLDSGGSHVFATPPTTIINSKRQVVLPKRNWKQMSFPVQPANFPPGASAADADAGTGDSESELKRHLTRVDDKLPSSPADVVENQLDKDVSSGSLTDEVPRKKQRLILLPKPSKQMLEPCSSTETESFDSCKQTSSTLVCGGTVPSEHGHSDEPKEDCNKVQDTISGAPLDKVSESNDEELRKSAEVKRQFGIKRTSPLKCAHCQFTASRLPDLRRHLLEHTGDTVYECRRCSRSFRNRIGLYLHEQRKHKTELSDTLETPSPDETGPAAEDAEQTAAETHHELGNGADGPVSKQKKKCNKSLRSQLKRKLDDPATPESKKLAGEEQGEGLERPTSALEVDGKERKKKERSGASKRWTETVEMVQSAGESDHFKIVIRRKSSVGEEVLETIDGVNNGMMCRYCCYVAKIPAQLTQHMKIHTGERDYWCVVSNCRYQTIWRCDMKRHFRKFHPDVVERNGGNYHDLLQRCYQPSKLLDKAESSPSTRVNVFKMSKRQRRRLLKLKNKQHSTEQIPADAESQEGDNSATKLSFVKIAPKSVEQDGGCQAASSSAQSGAKKPPSDSEAKKSSHPVKLAERFRPYKCSECGRRSNWRWDLKKHIETVHKKAAVIIKLNDDVARATYADIFSSQGGRNGIRLPRRQTPSSDSLPRDEPKCGVAARAEESSTDPDGKAPMPELEKTLSQAPAPSKSIGVVDRLQLKRFQCSVCPYRSNHRGDLGRHMRMRHGRGKHTINVLSAELALSTLHAYRLQYNRQKAWMDSQTKTAPVRTQLKLQHGKREELEEKVAEVDGEAEKTPAQPECVDDGGSRRQHYKDFWYLDDGKDETKCCDMCPFKTDRTGLLELHKLRHRAPAAGSSSSSVAYSCPHCPYFVRTSRQLERHMALHEDSTQPHHDPLTDSARVQHTSSCGPAKTRYVCEKCPFVSMIRNEFWLHRRHHFVPKVEVPYLCDLCSFWSTDRRSMCDHSALHSQTYYPRLSIPVISRYRSARVDHGTREEQCRGKAVANSQPEVSREIVDDVTASGDGEMELESCPQLDAVDELTTAASHADVQDCCPLLERECPPPPLDTQESIVVDMESADSPESVVVKTEPADGQESVVVSREPAESIVCPAVNDESPSSGALMMSGCSEDPAGDVDDAACLADNSEDDLKLDILTYTCPVSVVAESAVLMSRSDDLMTESRRADEDERYDSDADDVTVRGNTDTLTSDTGHVTLRDNQSDGSVESRCVAPLQLQAEVSRRSSACCDACRTQLRLSQEYSDDVDSSGLPTNTSPHHTDSPAGHTLAAESDGTRDVVLQSSCDTGDHAETGKLHGKNAVTDQQTAAGDTQASESDGTRVDVLKTNCDMLEMETGMVGPEYTQSGNDAISDQQTPADSGAGKAESKSDGSWSDGECGCGLQCPYCFFSIASVRLLRQHMVFHLAVSDAVKSPVFDARLDCVDDGRMDDDRCDGLVQLCTGCRHLAELTNHDPSDVTRSFDPLNIPDNQEPLSGWSDSDLVTVSELGDKTSFMSTLSLSYVTLYT